MAGTYSGKGLSLVDLAQNVMEKINFWLFYSYKGYKKVNLWLTIF
jgi:hypothetical protein